MALSTEAVRPALRRAWFRALLWRGQDLTESVVHSSCLVLAPHPDDETLGCGALIRRKRTIGTPVRVVIATDGRRSHRSERIAPEDLAEIRRQEAFAACGVLGVEEENVLQFGYQDSTLGARIGELSDRLAGILAEFAPQHLLIPSRLDDHADHRALNQAARSALRQLSPSCRVAEYTIGTSMSAAVRLLLMGGLSRADLPWGPAGVRVLGRWLRRSRPELVATGPYLDAKRAAIGRYRSQTTNLTGEETWTPGLDQRAVEKFLQPYEIFFPLPNELGARLLVA